MQLPFPQKLQPRAIAAGAALIYLFLGVIWIFGSDLVLHFLVDDPGRVARLQTLKGWGYILVTACLLYLTLSFFLRRMEQQRLQRERHENALRESELRSRQILENVSDIIFSGTFREDAIPFQLTFISRASEVFGFPLQEILDQPALVANHLHPEDLPMILASVETLRRGESLERQYRIRRRGSEEYRWFEDRVVPQIDQAGRVAGFFGVARDVTERLQGEEWQRLTRRVLEASSQGVIITDAKAPDNPIIEVNEAFERITGYKREEAIGRNCRFLTGPKSDPEARAELRSAIHEQRSALVELVSYRKDGSTFWNTISLYPVTTPGGETTHFVWTQTDITKFKNLEEKFLQAQKMEVVGRLASGVAHDFNNILAVIMGYAGLAKESLPREGPLHQYISEIEAAARHAASLPRRLLGFARKEVAATTTFDLNSLIRDITGMLTRLIGTDIELICRLCDEPVWIDADPSQIEQVVLNLVVNARDAMPEGGQLILETQVLSASAPGLEARFAGRSVALLSVTDTGTGMSDEVKNRLFEPFFTTKAHDKGTGLGLATCREILEERGGSIQVTSSRGAGATFSAFIPCVPAPAQGPVAGPKPAAALAGTELLLIVEDNESLRELTVVALADLGYRILQASDGREALDRFRESDPKPDLVVTDLVMPELSGYKVYAALRREVPDLPVLFTAAYPDDDVLRTCLTDDRAGYLQKPFTPAILAARVRAMLEQTGWPPARGAEPESAPGDADVGKA